MGPSSRTPTGIARRYLAQAWPIMGEGCWSRRLESNQRTAGYKPALCQLSYGGVKETRATGLRG